MDFSNSLFLFYHLTRPINSYSTYSSDVFGGLLALSLKPQCSSLKIVTMNDFLFQGINIFYRHASHQSGGSKINHQISLNWLRKFKLVVWDLLVFTLSRSMALQCFVSLANIYRSKTLQDQWNKQHKDQNITNGLSFRFLQALYHITGK